jgi:hypothetical protein
MDLTRYGFVVARAPQAEVKIDENSLAAALVNAGFKAIVIGKGRIDIAARGRTFSIKAFENNVIVPWTFFSTKERPAVELIKIVIANAKMLTCLPETFKLGTYEFESKKLDPGEISCVTMPSLTISVRYQPDNSQYMVEAYTSTNDRGNKYFTNDANVLEAIVRNAASVLLRDKANEIESTIASKLNQIKTLRESANA